ncbi:Asp-tRNA(Asn)/Glu-tRNA(Gln) amidotransferase subunit GatC [Corynebacterium lactis]|uniref:Aspartyl/glutamyl-tRNA(Asn/Gln) amidotransferase subunit C n=1 Tax=Corynebacterium lactis RW2-5 TaxID=1408189 RepID=A0A0K2GZA9_9CORY|nr:Asp-tRNA(Asn)/Glu-tRNA(Gln) amidotransferase subunit GatC [Corynebacterium lactis]ALA67125.1 glutamyl-tRNA amidotransferase subunit C [Corynebacterium lactis RW2-5]
MPAISRDEVAHLARLSRLALTDAELDEFAGQIDGIINHVQAVQEVAADDVEPMSHPSSLAGVMREDVVNPTLTPEQALDQAPSKERQRFEVPQILGE